MFILDFDGRRSHERHLAVAYREDYIIATFHLLLSTLGRLEFQFATHTDSLVIQFTVNALKHLSLNDFTLFVDKTGNDDSARKRSLSLHGMKLLFDEVVHTLSTMLVLWSSHLFLGLLLTLLGEWVSEVEPEDLCLGTE